VARNIVTDDDLYRFHVANVRSVERALCEIELLSKDAIKKSRSSLVASLLRAHILLLGAWTECRLKKLLYEKGRFLADERNLIGRADTQEKRWKLTIEAGFKRRYHLKTLTVTSLKHTAYGQYQTLLKALDEDIRPVIESRNKLAHGQWEYPLNNEGNAIAQDAMARIKSETLLSCKFKRRMIDYLAALVHDLVVSSSFERDFDDHYRNFLNARGDLQNRKYAEWWVPSLQARYARGQTRRKLSALPQSPASSGT
jgi:hypothetical protein